MYEVINKIIKNKKHKLLKYISIIYETDDYTNYVKNIFIKNAIKSNSLQCLKILTKHFNIEDGTFTCVNYTDLHVIKYLFQLGHNSLNNILI